MIFQKLEDLEKSAINIGKNLRIGMDRASIIQCSCKKYLMLSMHTDLKLKSTCMDLKFKFMLRRRIPEPFKYAPE